MIINSIAPNMSTLYRHLDGGYCNRDFPIARCTVGYMGVYVTAISESRMRRQSMNTLSGNGFRLLFYDHLKVKVVSKRLAQSLKVKSDFSTTSKYIEVIRS